MEDSRGAGTPACSAGTLAGGLNKSAVPPFEVYIFDVDGTLLDSAQDICGAIQHVLSEHVPEPLPFEYLKSFVGFHLDDVFLDVLPHAKREQLDKMIELYKANYLGRKHASTRPFPGVIEALNQLGGRKT